MSRGGFRGGRGGSDRGFAGRGGARGGGSFRGGRGGGASGGYGGYNAGPPDEVFGALSILQRVWVELTSRLFDANFSCKFGKCYDFDLDALRDTMRLYTMQRWEHSCMRQREK